MASPNRNFGTALIRARRSLGERVFVRAALWRNLRRDARHPVAGHMRRQLKPGRRIQLLPLCLAFSLILFFAIANVYLLIDSAVVWTLPLWLMAFSTLYCAIWITRIVALISRSNRDGVLNEVSVIPPGPIFITLTICKVVLNAGDAVVWLSALRRGLAGIVLVGVLMALAITLTQVSVIEPARLASFALEAALLAAVISLEHEQSSVLACLLSIAVSTRLRENIDTASAAVACFALLQILTYALPVALVVAWAGLGWSAALLLYLLAREGLISALWHLVLHQANAESALAFGEGRRGFQLADHAGRADRVREW